MTKNSTLRLRVKGKQNGETSEINKDIVIDDEGEHSDLFKALWSFYEKNPGIGNVEVLLTGDE